jgi:hypothetical protein
MTKEEIVEHPDFVKLVKGAVKRLGLKRRMDTLGIDIDDLIHLTRCFIWKRVIRPDVALSTVVYYFTYATVTDELSRLNKEKKQRSLYFDDEDNEYARVECNRASFVPPIEATDMIDKLRREGLSYEVDTCLAFESRYSSKDMAKMMGKKCSRQRMDQIKRMCYKRLRLAVDGMSNDNI